MIAFGGPQRTSWALRNWASRGDSIGVTKESVLFHFYVVIFGRVSPLLLRKLLIL